MKIKTNKYHIIFVVTLIPYILLFFILLFVAISGHNYFSERIYGIAAIWNWSKEFFANHWFILDSIYLLCILYQFLYFLEFKNPEEDEYAKYIKKRKKEKIILLISFIPYLLLILYAIYSAIFGFTLTDSPSDIVTVYSTGAIFLVLIFGTIWLCIIPIFPTCFIYQITYLKVKTGKIR